MSAIFEGAISRTRLSGGTHHIVWMAGRPGWLGAIRVETTVTELRRRVAFMIERLFA